MGAGCLGPGEELRASLIEVMEAYQDRVAEGAARKMAEVMNLLADSDVGFWDVTSDADACGPYRVATDRVAFQVEFSTQADRWLVSKDENHG